MHFHDPNLCHAGFTWLIHRFFTSSLFCSLLPTAYIFHQKFNQSQYGGARCQSKNGCSVVYNPILSLDIDFWKMPLAMHFSVKSLNKNYNQVLVFLIYISVFHEIHHNLLTNPPIFMATPYTQFQHGVVQVKSVISMQVMH